MAQIRIIEEKLGSQFVFTSPDVPGLYVAHTDRETALRDIRPTIAAMDEVRRRIASRKALEHNVASFG